MQGSKDTQDKLSEKKEEIPKELIQENIKKLEEAIPVLSQISPEKRKSQSFIRLIHLITELASTQYDSKRKYEQMYKIIEIGNLMQSLLPNVVTNNVGVPELERNKDITKLTGLNYRQQWCLFNISRNLCADDFHRLYEQEGQQLFQNYLALLTGNTNITFFIDEKYRINRVSKAIEKGYIDFKASLEKIFNQVAYFLFKARELSEIGQVDGSRLAIIAAGNCIRDYFRSLGQDSKKFNESSVLRNLASLRDFLAHGDDGETQKYQEILLRDTSKESIAALIDKVMKESPTKIDITQYGKHESNSPRAYSAVVLKDAVKPRDSASRGNVAVTVTNRSAPLQRRTEFVEKPNEREEKERDREREWERQRERDQERERERQRERDRERDREKQKERDRERDRERQKEKDRERERERERERPRERDDKSHRGGYISEKKRDRNPEDFREGEEDRSESDKEREEEERKKRRSRYSSHKEKDFPHHQKDDPDPDNPGAGGTTSTDNSRFSGSSTSRGQTRSSTSNKGMGSKSGENAAETISLKENISGAEALKQRVKSLNQLTGKKRNWEEQLESEKTTSVAIQDETRNQKPENGLKKYKTRRTEVKTPVESPEIEPEKTHTFKNGR